MKCPYCAHLESKVVDSRPSDEGASIRRRRECLACHKRFTTYETMESLPLMVIKKDNSREFFDRDKLINRIMRATYKRPVSPEQIEAIADDIENTALNSFDREISRRDIGERVMEKLKDLDEVAYVRFASVYREFKDVNSFMQELRKLMDKQ